MGVRVLLAAAGLALSGCGDSLLPSGAAPPPAAPQDLCVDSGCGARTRLLHVADAENLHFTPDGRLFVSGGVNVYEVVRDGAGYAARPLAAAECNFTGLAQRGNVLYATCFSGQLYAAALTASPALAPIHALAGMSAANGTAVGPSGELYIVNGPAGGFPDPKIVRLEFNPADPFEVAAQEDWLGSGLEFPNGLAVAGRTLYVTDGSSEFPGLVKAIEILPDGSPGTPRTLATLPGILDDLSLVDDHLLVSGYSNGTVALLGPDGAVVAETGPGGFDSPSAVRVGRAPLFNPTDLLVTEKGLLGEHDSANGNALSVFRRTNP